METFSVRGNTEFRPAARILAIDDSKINMSFIANTFQVPDYELLSASDAREGFRLAREKKPEVILLDILMPGVDGYELADELKRDPVTADIPIIFLTALDAIQDKLKAFESGAVDFISKPFNYKELMARVRTHVALRRNIAQKERFFAIAMEECRRAAIARIAAGLSHNFNNMLAATAGNIMFMEHIVAQESKGNTALAEAFGDVKKSLARMQSLIKKFLLLANRSNELKGGTPEPNILELYKVIDDAVKNTELARNLSTVQNPFECRNLLPSNAQVCCDDSHLHEVLQLLLGEVMELSMGTATVSFEPEKSTLKGMTAFRVTVHGIQLAPELRDSIFEPFALPVASVGTGLSFAVAKYLIELNKGNILAEFPDEKNVIFKIEIPKEK